MARPLRIKVKDREFKALKKDAPKIVNQHLNTAARLMASAASREFASSELTKAQGFNIKSRGRGRLKTLPKTQPKTAVRYRRAGLKATLKGHGVGRKKALFFFSHNPIYIQRITGATIRPRRDKWLYIKQTKPKELAKGLYRKVPHIVIEPTQKFEEWFSTWMRTKSAPYLNKEIDRAVARVNTLRAEGKKVA